MLSGRLAIIGLGGLVVFGIHASSEKQFPQAELFEKASCDSSGKFH